MQSFNLNLVPGSFQQVFNCSQGDIGRQLTAKLFDGSTEYAIPAGSTVKIKATKPSGFGFDESATFSGSTVTITTAETMTNEWGRFPAELVITKDGNVIGTANFLFNVEKNPHPDSTVDGDAEEVIPELTLLVERVEAAASSVLDMEVVATTLPAGSQASYSYDEDLNKATFGIPQGEAGAGAAGVVASAYSSSKTYKVGDYVLHNSNLYRCITAITTAEAFTAAHWTQIVLADDVSDLKTDLQSGYITERISNGDLVSNEAVQSGTGEIVSLSNYSRTDYLELPETSKITVKNDSGEGYYLNALCFYNSSKVFISGISSPDARTEITVPSNAKYIIYSGYTNMMGYSYILYEVESKIIQVEKASLSKDEANSILSHYIKGNQFPNNLFNVFDWQDNAYIEYDTGKVNTNGASGYFCTGFIAITAGTTYKSNKGRNLAWYNSSKEYISGVSGTTIQTGVTAPSGASYIRFTINKTSDEMSEPSMLYFTDSASFSIDVTIPNLVVSNVKAWCYGKKINWIGDSIVDGQDFDEEVCSALGLIKNNEYGIDGSTIALKSDGTDGRNALCVRYANMTNDADIIAVSCGTNDFEYAWCPIGTIDDPDDGTSNNTFYGALKTLCKGLIDKYPKKVIFFTTPIKRAQAFTNGAGGTYTADDVTTTPFSKNKYGMTLIDYADIIKEVCGYYSIPVLDMNRESLLNPHLTSQQDMFDSVLTHPNTTGQKIMARRVAGWLTQLGYAINGL